MTPTSCDVTCANGTADRLNRHCECAVVDVSALRGQLAARLPSGAVDADKHAHLFSPFALFVDRATLDAIAGIARSVVDVARNPHYVAHVLRWAPEIARCNPGSPGGVLGLDFHLTVEGPRLIEINTNPGGLLLGSEMLDVVSACAPNAWVPWVAPRDARAATLEAWVRDMTLQRDARPARLAIVDADPTAQFLYPEFELYRQGFSELGIEALICAPEALTWRDGALHHEGRAVDAVYNRLTDFALGEPASAPLATAYRAGAIALTPHPRAHAVFADKRNLIALGDAARLSKWGVDPGDIERLTAAIPETRLLDDAVRDRLWTERKLYFFKPAAGYGSRGSYRGDKLTRSTWDALAGGTYVAQRVAPPSVRVAAGGGELKADVRCFADDSGVLLFLARLYQGQTTNMRTPGGGFAAVFTQPRDHAARSSVVSADSVRSPRSA